MTKRRYAGLLLLILLPLTAHSQTLVVLEPGDKKLVIRGFIGDDNSFVGTIGVNLEATGSNGIKVTTYPHGLTMSSGAGRETIRPSVVPSELTLGPNAPATFQVKVTGVKEPGEYRGKISLSLAGQARKEDVELTVWAGVRPSLSLLTENERLQANLVNCRYDCSLARLLLSRAALQGDMELGFEKPLGAPLLISNVTVAVKGDHTKFKVDEKLLKISPNQQTESQAPVGSNQPGAQQASPQVTPTPDPSNPKTDLSATRKYLTLPVTITREELPADHYSGNIYLTVAGQTNALKVPVDFNVRSAPLWPVLILLLGILLGRLFKFMQDKGNAIADALESINRLEFRLKTVDREDAEIVRPMLSAARDLVHEDKVAEAVAAVNAISSRLSALNELRQIQVLLNGKDGEAVEAIRRDIEQARVHISLRQDENAKALIVRIKDAIVALERTPGITDSDFTDLGDAVVSADAASAAMVDMAANRRRTDSRVRRGLVQLSGLSNEFRNEATLFLVRPILWFALLLGLLALGMKELYIDNPIFGANPFADFLGLVFWGVSTDVASRTLSGLKIKNPGRPASG